MLRLLCAAFRHFVASKVNQMLHFILYFVRNLLPHSSPSFNVRISRIYDLLETHDETSDVITSALNDLNLVYPLPRVQIISKWIWPYEPTVRICIPTHLKSTFADAINLLKATGRTISPADEIYLYLLLTNYRGWSATYREHMNDPWVEFFHTRYPQLKGLTPILDSMTYVEELVDFPDGYHFPFPQFFLLATMDSYFVYDAADGEEGLLTAGETLEDVYNGMKDWRWAESSDDPWGLVDSEECLPPDEYFHHYYRKENGNFGVWGNDNEYPGKVRRGFLQSLRGLLNIK